MIIRFGTVTLPRRLASTAIVAAALVTIPLASCSSDDGDGGADAAAGEGGADGSSSLPSCVANGYQCQLKGCLSGFVEAPADYSCGSSTGSCCQRGAPTLDASTAADAKDDG